MTELGKLKSLAALADDRRWVAYQIELRKGRPTKVPKNPRTGENARVPTDPATYDGTRAEAEQRFQKIKRSGADGGIGIVLGRLDDDYHLVGVDLDSSIENDVIAGWAKEVIKRFETYAEVSPSGTGVKLFFMMTATGFAKLTGLIDGKTRKFFSAGEHREVALDTARFYAVTDQRLKGCREQFRLVSFADVKWFVEEAGPNYLARQAGNGAARHAGNGHDHHRARVNSGSGFGIRFFMSCRAKGMSYEQACKAIGADAGPAGQWARRVDERQLQRAWNNGGEFLGNDWPTLDQDALYGLAGEVVATFAPHTEADDVALLLYFLAAFGNALGRGPYYQVESDQHFTNLFVVIVGETSKARKGVAANRIRALMQTFLPRWVEKCVQGGLSSGEGVIAAIQDEVTKTGKNGKKIVVVKAVDDKRLFLDEREFFGALAVMKREGNIVSCIVRDAWDGRDLGTLTKQSPTHATEPMVSIVGSITQEELRRSLDETSMANGYANRFLYACVRRARELPFGGNLKQEDIGALGGKVKTVFGKAYQIKCVTMDAEARALWASEYSDLSAGQPGLLGAITGRAEAQTVRLALIYALLDASPKIRIEHLKAALALWRYCEASARHIFGDPIADNILRGLRNAPDGMTRTQISELFGRNLAAAKIGAALGVLAAQGKAKCEVEAPGENGGKPSEIWAAV
jgi:hypothetical protein